MIVSFANAQTKRFAEGERVKPFEPFRQKAERVLDRLGAATSLTDIATFPGIGLKS